mmetsp:Transcript_62616/g.123248  ORF Transcript_62616/g.123248 Transcript_62616/m.123248 type:complete len:148 (-) Transcript_62616:7-450(-)
MPVLFLVAIGVVKNGPQIGDRDPVLATAVEGAKGRAASALLRVVLGRERGRQEVGEADLRVAFDVQVLHGLRQVGPTRRYPPVADLIPQLPDAYGASAPAVQAHERVPQVRAVLGPQVLRHDLERGAAEEALGAEMLQVQQEVGRQV